MSTLAELRDPLRAWLRDSASRESALLSEGYQGAVYLFEYEQARWVVKQAGDGWLAGWLYRLMLRREAEAYEKLAGVAGVPKSLGILDNKWLILEFIDGEPLREARYTLADRERFYTRLHKVITDIHAAGVAHGDLKRKQNILVTRDEQPVVLDFGTAVRRDGALADRLLFDLIAQADLNAWIKAKYENDYSRISTEDSQWYRPSMTETGLRAILRFWRMVTFRQLRKRRRAHRNQ